MVITGDATQVDLPGGTSSGLRVIEDVLTGVDDVEFCRLSSADVVRHRLVSDIIDAYARWDVASAAGARGREGDRRSRPADRDRRTRNDT
jgi:phosphate starvation-inducible protein PhoH and related proteins